MVHTPSAADARARFAAATDRHLTGPLTADVVIEPCDAATWAEHNQRLWGSATDRSPPYEVGRLATDDERAHGADLDAALMPGLEHRVLLRAGDEVVGAYWGFQETSCRYYMVNSVVARGWQGRGIYRALLARVMAAASDAGFRQLYSRHRADNNAVLVPKLKAGFVIGGFEISPRWGLLVHLHHYPSEAMRRALAHRVDGSYAEVLRAGGVAVP